MMQCSELYVLRWFFRNERPPRKNSTHSLNMEIAEECPVVLPTKPRRLMMNGILKVQKVCPIHFCKWVCSCCSRNTPGMHLESEVGRPAAPAVHLFAANDATPNHTMVWYHNMVTILYHTQYHTIPFARFTSPRMQHQAPGVWEAGLINVLSFTMAGLILPWSKAWGLRVRPLSMDPEKSIVW